MNRRKFVQQMVATASLAAVYPLVGDAQSARDFEKSSAGFPVLRRPSIAGLDFFQTELLEGFSKPPESAAPWVYWVWLGVDTTPAAMTYDLEQMKAKGIAGFILYGNQAGSLPREIPAQILVEKDSRLEYEFVKNSDYDDFHTTPILAPPLPSWTPHWRERIRYVAKEAARLDLKFCLTIGLAGTSAQIPDEYGNQELIWTETSVSGPVEFDGILPSIGPHGRPSSYRRDVAVLAVPNASDFAASQTIDLTSKMDGNGRLTWKAPAGKWTILRFSQMATGAHNQWGIFSDVMNPEALDKLWEVTMAPLLQEMSPAERKGLIGLEDDSWEGGKFTWTKNFPEEFRKRRGYDLIPYLPVLAGTGIGDVTTRRQVERDYRLTVSDLMADYHYGHLEKLCKENGLLFYSEAAGPNLHDADLLKTTSEVDVMMAEFWVPSFHRPQPKNRFFARNAACASHIYGTSVNMDEAFTSLGTEWEESPFSMKPVSDQAFCDGVNRICVHNFSHSPSLTARPGYVYVAGTHYEPGITWWEQTPAFNTYLARCSYLLQQGEFVADAIFYKGDNIGDGEPMKEIHPTLGEGYDYDCSNADVLLTRMSVHDGRIVLHSGMSYRVLILPENQPMALNTLQKVAELVEAGATIVGPPPIGLAGLPLQPNEEQQFNAFVARLWGGDHQTSIAARRQIGAGYLIAGQSARQTLLDAGVPPDFEQTGLSPSGEIRWIHRRTSDTDIYFIASQWQPAEKVECTFRVSGKQPELWDPVSGTIRDVVAFRQNGGCTIVPLEFDPCGSIFVVFRTPISSSAAGKATTNYPRNERVELTLSGPWDVGFDPKWGGPEKITFDQLVDWTARSEAGIKYYSGTAIYRKTFDLTSLPRKDTRVLLDLGELHEVGAVRLNGHDLGVIWTKPPRVDITNALRATENVLEITVVNLWPNRQIGDADLPKESQFTETNVHKFSSHSPLLPSGLLGPVRVLSVEEPG
jgi:alpha-L-rhamnosidase